MTQRLMEDPRQKDVLHQIQEDILVGKMADTSTRSDPKTLSAFLRDMEGFITHGGSGSNYVDAFLGSYDERWTAVIKSPGSAIVSFTVTNTTDLNSFAHPEFWSWNAITLD